MNQSSRTTKKQPMSPLVSFVLFMCSVACFLQPAEAVSLTAEQQWMIVAIVFISAFGLLVAAIVVWYFWAKIWYCFSKKQGQEIEKSISTVINDTLSVKV